MIYESSFRPLGFDCMEVPPRTPFRLAQLILSRLPADTLRDIVSYLKSQGLSADRRSWAGLLNCLGQLAGDAIHPVWRDMARTFLSHPLLPAHLYPLLPTEFRLARDFAQMQKEQKLQEFAEVIDQFKSTGSSVWLPAIQRGIDSLARQRDLTLVDYVHLLL